MFVDNFSKRPAGDRWGLPGILLIILNARMTRAFVAFFFLCETAEDASRPLETLSRWDHWPDSTRFFRLVVRLAVCAAREDAGSAWIACSSSTNPFPQSRLCSSAMQSRV